MRLIKPASIIIFLAFLLVIAGCGQKPVAEVNGEKISQAQFDNRLAYMKQMYQQNYGINFTGTDNQEMLDLLKGEVVQQLISERLLLQEADKRGVTVSDKEVKDRIDQDRQAVGDDKFAEYLKDRMKMTEKQYSQFWREQLTIRKLADTVTAGTKVSQTEVEKYYQEHKSDYDTPEQVKARHILLKTEAEAKQVIKELNQGAEFSELAESRSTDPSAKQNKGDLGYFDKNASLVAEFKTAAFELKTGEITPEPVKTEFGYHVIQVTDRKPASSQTFDQVKDKVESTVLQSKQSDAFTKFLNKLEKEAKITNNYKEASSQGEKSDNKK